ncbi:preprotein translocase subunit SecY [Acaryochloris sp. 'Moss Beach']|uniref:preprotein translocase subunit SecY n=1 Tax=Acaryochloris TaxID=155977 RepID=UPI001BAFB3A5|nr:MULTISPECIES: preprotein translocase subunit SecY [Acaryochloris]QUY43784.1 preprotein translocase subunit SecY [Acaryochloris marina S15]UJB68568.1 preprotein translocase subunit SecY [Acaryochloris sp. 'Moss Beach']
MVVSRGKTPSAQETFMQMAQAAGLRGRVFITLGLLILVRLGVRLPVPGINRAAFTSTFAGNPVFGFLDFFSGGGFSALGIFALGIIPFINASIILQLLTAALPSLERLQKDEGEAGRRKISQITRYVALGWAIIQSTGFAILINSAEGVVFNPGTIFIVQMVVALTAGSMFVMWVGELITERGVGNGASLLIFLSIVSGLPSTLGNALQIAEQGEVSKVIILISVFILMIVGIVFVQEGTRRIPIVYARRQVGRRTYQEQKSYLPLRLNSGGVMPIIFASAMLILPGTLAGLTNNPTIIEFAGYLSPNSSLPWVYVIFYLSMIVFFSYFYASLVVNPIDMSQNLKKMGASIPGIRPGRATTEYVEKVLNRLTLLGAFFLGAVVLVPVAAERVVGGGIFSGFGATSLLILVGVAIDTAKQIQTYVISQRYEGMVKQ